MKPNFYNGYNDYSYITRTPQSYYNNNKIIRNIGSISQTNRLRSNLEVIIPMIIIMKDLLKIIININI